MTAPSRKTASRAWKAGDLVLCDPSNRGHWHLAVVDSTEPVAGRPGVHITFDYEVNGVGTAFATHDELRPASVEQRAARSRRLSRGAPTRTVGNAASPAPEEG